MKSVKGSRKAVRQVQAADLRVAKRVAMQQVLASGIEQAESILNELKNEMAAGVEKVSALLNAGQFSEAEELSSALVDTYRQQQEMAFKAYRFNNNGLSALKDSIRPLYKAANDMRLESKRQKRLQQNVVKPVISKPVALEVVQTPVNPVVNDTIKQLEADLEKTLLESIKATKRADRAASRVIFMAALATLELKVIQLEDEADKNPKYDRAANVARVLIAELENNAKAYFDDVTLSPEEFQTNCIQALNDASYELGNHRGWSAILKAIAFYVTSILTLGTANLVSQLTTKDVRFFKPAVTDSFQKLKEFESTVDFNGLQAAAVVA